MERNVAASLALMLVTDDDLPPGRMLIEACRKAVAGGVSAVQLRRKHADARDLAEEGRALIAALPVPVLINDRLDVALAVGAAGAHLGPDDFPVAAARRLTPPGFLIGASVGGPAEAEFGAEADYWGIGPWRATRTKPDAGAPLGAAGFSAILALAGRIPCVAIGGVLPDDIPAVLGAGGRGVAVVSGILGSDDIESAALRYRLRLAEARELN